MTDWTLAYSQLPPPFPFFFMSSWKLTGNKKFETNSELVPSSGVVDAVEELGILKLTLESQPTGHVVQLSLCQQDVWFSAGFEAVVEVSWAI